MADNSIKHARMFLDVAFCNNNKRMSEEVRPSRGLSHKRLSAIIMAKAQSKMLHLCMDKQQEPTMQSLPKLLLQRFPQQVKMKQQRALLDDMFYAFENSLKCTPSQAQLANYANSASRLTRPNKYDTSMRVNLGNNCSFEARTCTLKKKRHVIVSYGVSVQHAFCASSFKPRWTQTSMKSVYFRFNMHHVCRFANKFFDESSQSSNRITCFIRVLQNTMQFAFKRSNFVLLIGFEHQPGTPDTAWVSQAVKQHK